MNPLLSSALAGAATGGRSMTALAALSLTTPDRTPGQTPALLTRPAVKIALVAAAVGELVMDKLPKTPSRLIPPALGARGLAGLACGAIISRRSTAGGSASLATMAVAPMAALATSFLGARWRAFAGRTLGQDLVGALVEDAATIGVATLAARR